MLSEQVAQDVLSVLGVVGTPACQELLCETMLDERHSNATRAAALFGIGRVREYEAATLDALAELVANTSPAGEMGKHAALMYGTVAFNLHLRDRVEQADAMRTVLVDRWADAALNDEFGDQFLFALALNNSVRGLPIDVHDIARNRTRKRQEGMDGKSLLPECSGTYEPTGKPCSAYTYDAQRPGTS